MSPNLRDLCMSLNAFGSHGLNDLRMTQFIFSFSAIFTHNLEKLVRIQM